MSAWVTPAGSIGTYTQQQTFVFNFQATTTLGGKLVYQVAGSWPPGSYRLTTLEPVPGTFVGQLTATPDFVAVATVYGFTISATEITGSGATTNPRVFTLTVNNTQWVTDSSLGGYVELSALSIQLEASPSVIGNTIVYTLLNGNLPASNNINSPLTLSSTGLISGTPGQVSEITTSEFTVRAQELDGLGQQVSFRDRTFTLSISGTTTPSFIAASGSTLLSILDSRWVDYQVLYANPDPGTSAVITLAAGNLPPGLEITTDGVIRGYAQPPVTASGAPTTKIYTFTLRVRSASGESLGQFSISVQNQQTVSGFVGREPTILNTRPLTLFIDPADPDYNYYNDGNLGNVTSDNYFVFRFLGYDFDGDAIGYDLLPANTFSNIGLSFDAATGWVTGTIASSSIPSLDTYNFLISAYKLSNPSVRSQNFKFSITIVNNIDVRINWLTDSDLGTINNGDTSIFNVKAESVSGKPLQYRIVGNQFTSNLYSIVRTDNQFYSFGELGGYVYSNSSGSEWQSSTQTLLTGLQFSIWGSVYNPYTTPGTTVVVGQDPSGRGVFASSGDGTSWLYNYAPGLPDNVYSVTFNDSAVSPVYVAVGTAGFSMRSLDGVNWTQYATGSSDDLYNVIYAGAPGSERFVAVGARGTVLYSADGITWTDVSNSIVNDLKSITYTGSAWIIVGDLGIIVRATNITNSSGWTQNNVFTNYDYASVAYSTGNVVIVGSSGAILTSANDGVNWTVQDGRTVNDLYNVIAYGSEFWACGVAGSIFTTANLINWTSPTVSDLPDNLVFKSSGDITGRLAFEPADTVTPVGTSTHYSFTVQAFCPEPGFEEINSTRTFNLVTYQKWPLPYDNLYIKALVEPVDRDFVLGMLDDTTLVPPDAVYRPTDPYFGRATAIVYQHMYGVPSVAAADFYAEYIAAVTENHYWRNITLGPVTWAVARDGNNEIVYEAVYSEVMDNLVNSQGVSISKQITWPRPIKIDNVPYFTASTTLYDSQTYYDPEPVVKIAVNVTGTTIVVNNVTGLAVGMVMTGSGVLPDVNDAPPVVTAVDTVTNTIEVTVSQTLSPNTQLVFSRPVNTSSATQTARVLYPNSLTNMRLQIGQAIGFINDSSLLPLWMTSQQADGSTLGYKQAFVLCYVKPGYGQTVAGNINAYMAAQGRYINQVDFQIDRFEVNRALTSGFEGGTSTAPIWTTLPSGGVVGDSENSYIYFPRKTILPTVGNT